MSALIQKALGSRGLHYFSTRFGWKGLRSLSFDEKFKNGDWKFTSENPDLVALVEMYAREGHILTLGCGMSAIAGILKPESFQSFLGVDLSAEAIRLAAKYANHKVRFEQGDMLRYESPQPCDVILFPNSVYYVGRFSRRKLLHKLRRALAPGGRIIVTLAQPDRYMGILKMIRRNFKIEVDRTLQGNGGHVIVFS